MLTGVVQETSHKYIVASTMNTKDTVIVAGSICCRSDKPKQPQPVGSLCLRAVNLIIRKKMNNAKLTVATTIWNKPEIKRNAKRISAQGMTALARGTLQGGNKRIARNAAEKYPGLSSFVNPAAISSAAK